MYLAARADVPNHMDTNGEKNIIHCVIKNLAKNDESMVVFDVGANIGDWTMAAWDIATRLDVEHRLEVHAFEPAPETFTTLERQIAQHEVPDRAVHLVRRALSSIEGNTEMFIVGENAATNSLHQDAMNPKTHRIAIEMTTGDKYCERQGINKIHFVKCDAEGADMDVLSGFKDLFEAERILGFQFEYNHRWIYSRHYLKDVFDLMAQRPYKIGKVTPDKVELYESWHPELERFFEGNYLIIHEDILGWFDVANGKFDGFNTYGA